MKRFLALLLSGALAAGPAHTSNVLPDLGDVATSELSPLAERRIGEAIMQDIRWRDRAYLDDIEVEDYLNRLGGRLVEASSEADGEFHFFAIDDPSVNAFALPGGYVGLHTGLLLTAESESELASVLGHEVAHVTQRHIAQLFGKQSQTSMVMLGSILLAVLAARSNSQVSEAALAAGQAGAIQSQLGYTRGFEREADRIGLQILERAGFDPRGMPGFFERLQRKSRIYENNAPGYLRTHPLTQERFTDMQSRVAQMRYRQVLDSEDFHFVRAKLRTSEGAAADAVRRFEARVAAEPDNRAEQYGLARALLRAGRLDAADAAISRLRSEGESPFVDMLAAERALAARDPASAVALLEAAVARFPRHGALRYALVDALLDAGRAGDAASIARAAVHEERRDVRMWQRLSRAEQRLDRITAHHRAQAEVYVLRGSFPAAIEQLEIARRVGDGDFYDMSAVDARMRELKVEEKLRRGETFP